MRTMQIFEANRGSRNQAEAAALLLDAARAHLAGGRTETIVDAVGDAAACILLANLSLMAFPGQEPKVRRGGL